jgi:hypothetical protein
MSAKAVAALYRLNAPLADMGYLDNGSGMRFPLYNSVSVVDTPGISWSDGSNLVSIEPNDDAAAKTLELELTADAQAGYTSAALKFTATVDGGGSTSLTILDSGVESDGQVKATGFLTGVNVWTLGGYTVGAPAADGSVLMTIDGASYQVLVNKV